MAETTDVRAEIAALERELRDKQERLGELRQSLPPEPVEDHVLLDADGSAVRLSELFGEKDDLLLVHNMGRSCPFCTLWADGFQGVLPYLEDRAAFVVVSPDAPEDQQAFQARRGWTFRMVSARTSPFTHAMGFAAERDGRSFLMPGVSAFHRLEDGTVVRTGRASFAPGEIFCSLFHLFDLLRGGAGDWMPHFQGDRG
jgi:predicted dithiol-disulfide oxidoreductase (DUF899 family)